MFLGAKTTQKLDSGTGVKWLKTRGFAEKVSAELPAPPPLRSLFTISRILCFVVKMPAGGAGG